jgi:hypothetical protein
VDVSADPQLRLLGPFELARADLAGPPRGGVAGGRVQDQVQLRRVRPGEEAGDGGGRYSGIVCG